jgi:hypothetical protein
VAQSITLFLRDALLFRRDTPPMLDRTSGRRTSVVEYLATYLKAD